ncbi:MAG: hypothetical protein UX10_C0001G0002 [Candidatus Magasanikbacteria bacterium GW2011_GWA2_45_39]|uniref:Uncharacterized protein n=2 Tax=Candidatus Magasanikiibacteriota TaxID=1752731 RepID=A0A0G1QY14_9BACT|nr:MAG: hypothetical protein UX10_C0001G0002 [Candidatus Magasanikbacteria bacterium GW2011_GWA2_45_39]KKU13585.1 MAG: hypothetical protein UX20_C0017G0003 [Candidatus Magasanikbacteria bacterium GW2011_GWC2_45_8]HBW73873.1 hypothetical protein [Candidatus Magasanikbacteria bacterium]
MKINFAAKAILICRKDVIIQPLETTEISLDCAVCKKLHRTVIIHKDIKKTQCAGHNFLAVIKTIENNKKVWKSFFMKEDVHEIIYHIEYEYREFEDPRDRTGYDRRMSNEYPSWGRINFLITCPKCNTTQKHFTQNNLVRPFIGVCEHCAYQLYKDDKEQPLFEKEV